MKKKIALLCLALFIFQGSSVALAQETSATSGAAVRAAVIPKNTHAQGSLEQLRTQAATLMEQGQHEEAYTLYGRLLRESPDDDLINLGYARASLRTQRPGQAVMAYERLLAKHPQEPILLKELAFALSMQNDTQRSAMELAKDTSASSDEKADLTEQWHKQHDRLQVNGKLRAGMIYDSNVNTGPASNDISLGNWNLSLRDGKAEESFAAYLGGQVDLAYRLDIVSPWWIVGSANALVRYNTNSQLYDLGLSSSEWVSGSAGIRYLGEKSLFELRAKAQIFDYAFEQNVFSIGPEATFAYALTPKVHLITKANLDSRTYSNNESYNGWYGSVGQYVRFFFGHEGSNVTLGARYLGGTAEENAYSYDGFEASLKFTFLLPYHDISISPFINYGGEYFHGPGSSLEEEHRHEHRLTAGLSVVIPLDDAWSVELGYQYVRNYSNSELYDYEQHITNVGLSWAF